MTVSAVRSSRTGRPSSAPPARSSLLNVGRRVDYALRALCYLAGQDEARVVTCTEIQARQGVPPHFLSKILRRLVSSGMLESVTGPRGGFRLGRPADLISVRAVFECVEGELALIECVEGRDPACCFASLCTQREMWRGAQRVLTDYLDGISVRQIADRAGLVSRLTGAGNASPSRP